MQSALILLFALFLFVNTQQFHFCLLDGEVQHGATNFPPSVKGGVEVTAVFGSDNFDLSFCAQQVVVSDNVFSCGTEGKFNISNPGKKTFQNSVGVLDFEDSYKFEYDGGNLVDVGASATASNSFFARDGQYFISVALSNYTGNNTQCVDFTFTVTYTACPDGKVGPNCQQPVPKDPNTKFTADVSQSGYSAKMFYQVNVVSVKFEGDNDEVAAQLEYPVRFTALVANVTGTNVNISSLKVSIRRGSFPDLDVADAKAVLDNRTLTLVLDNPIPDNYFIYVDAADGVQTYDVDFKTVSCPFGKYWVDHACNGNVTVLSTNRTVISATELDGDGDIHYFQVQNQNYLMFGVGTENLKNEAPSVSASLGSLPGALNGLVVAAGQKVNFISAVLKTSFLAEVDIDWFIAVNATVDSYYWANQACPNNCTKDPADSGAPNGLCNQNNGTCTCDKGYKGLFCTKDNRILWIILIVILVAIIIACVIGIPLAIHFKNKRRSSYETV